MAQAALGFLLRNLREERGLSLRELAQLADIDHAYVYRLETGAKESPSEEVLSKLNPSLEGAEARSRHAPISCRDTATEAGLVAHVRKDATVTFEEFAASSEYGVPRHWPPGLCNAH